MVEFWWFEPPPPGAGSQISILDVRAIRAMFHDSRIPRSTLWLWLWLEQEKQSIPQRSRYRNEMELTSKHRHSLGGMMSASSCASLPEFCIRRSDGVEIGVLTVECRGRSQMKFWMGCLTMRQTANLGFCYSTVREHEVRLWMVICYPAFTSTASVVMRMD